MAKIRCDFHLKTTAIIPEEKVEAADIFNSGSVNRSAKDLTSNGNSNNYTIKFGKNGAKGTMKNQTVSYGKSVALNKNKFAKRGYTFAGWATSKENARNLKVKYTDKQKVKNLPSKNGSTVTLYATWVKNNQKFKVSYKLNGKDAENVKANKTKYTVTTKTFKLKAPIRKGYKFTGWYTKKSGGKKVTKITKGSYGNKTLYARWKKVNKNAKPTPEPAPIDPSKWNTGGGEMQPAPGAEVWSDGEWDRLDPNY